ncbi:hypothetical protein RI129_007075 [Pyrocoelia pectoralis]|uniref:Tetraspanin n=1 Tax=Pyrocoelia pectoralis TaxID=417401 RepID=A0AAN7V7E1_9COLE
MARNRRTNECCSVYCLKSTLYIFNIIYLLAGLGILGIGIWTVMDKYKYVELLSTATYPVITYFLLGASGLVLLVTIMGCCAIWFNNRPYLICYIFLLSFVFLTEVMVGVLAYIYREQVHHELELNLNTTCLTNYKIDQQKTEYSTWRKQNLSGDNLVPDSCCKTIAPNCGAVIRPSNINYNSCLTKMGDHMRGHLFILCVVGLGICCIQIFGVIFSCQLYFKLKDYLDYL